MLLNSDEGDFYFYAGIWWNCIGVKLEEHSGEIMPLGHLLKLVLCICMKKYWIFRYAFA